MKVIQLFEGEKWKDSVSQWFKAVAGLTRKEDGPVSGIWPPSRHSQGGRQAWQVGPGKLGLSGVFFTFFFFLNSSQVSLYPL